MNKNLYMVVVGTDTQLGFVKASSSAGAREIVEKRWPKHQHDDGKFAVHFVCKDFTYESQFDSKDVLPPSHPGFVPGIDS